MTLQDGAEIASASRGRDNAGTIQITANEFRLTDSTVTTNAEQADGSNIVISASTLRLDNSSITATVNEEQGSGGNITVTSRLIVLEDSEIIAQASEGRGGNIGIVAQGFVTDAASIIDASSEKGINGTVNIESIIDLSESAAQLPQSFAEPIVLLEEPCAERLRGGQVSSFVVSGRAGVPAEPSGGLPSPMVDVPSTRWDTASAAHLTKRRETQSARAWRQASLAHDCTTRRWRTAVSRHAQ